MEVPYSSIPDMFLQRVAATPNAPAFAGPGPAGPAWLTWRQVAGRATAIAAGLIDAGVRPEDRVAILANTRLEWVLADLGIMCAGAATTTVYPTTAAAEADYILRDSGSVLVIAEDAAQAAKSDAVRAVLIDGDGPDTLASLEARGRERLAADPELVERVVGAIRPEQLATLIYTSGTTGTPKGVELLHAGWCWEAVAQGDSGLLRPGDLQYLWLPLSHSFGKTLLCGYVHVGVPTYVDGRVDKLVENLATVRPAGMAAAPRVFEKVYNRVITSVRAEGGAKLRVFTWALAVGKRYAAVRRDGGTPAPMLRWQHAVADRLVFAPIRARLGGQLRILVSGAAPLSVDIAEFFDAIGLTILEGYGLTETSAGSFVNRPDAYRLGTVGQPLGDLQVRIGDDGEVLLRGTPVMRGYHGLPAETAAALDPDGWLHTGDIGELDDDRFLRITDRKKDLIKTSGGKYVAPSHVEGLVKASCPFVSQALLVGQSRNYCTMLVTLDPDAIATWEGAAGRPYAELVAAEDVRALIGEAIERCNARLNRWETIKRFEVLPRDLSIGEGELTPSLKVKRRVVEEHFADRVDQMYEGAIVDA